MCGLFLRPSPRLLCTATKQKNNGQNLEEDLGHCEPKTDPPSADKTLLEEKVKLEEQLKETMVRTLRVCTLLDGCLHDPYGSFQVHREQSRAI